MPFGHLPVLEVDGKKGAQSIAIARYVAKMVKLTGANAWEDLEIDAIVDTLSDVKDSNVSFCILIGIVIDNNELFTFLEFYKIFEEDNAEEKEKLKEFHLKDTLPYYFEKLDHQAKKNNGYLVGQKVFPFLMKYTNKSLVKRFHNLVLSLIPFRRYVVPKKIKTLTQTQRKKLQKISNVILLRNGEIKEITNIYLL